MTSAAESGDADAQLFLARMYLLGEGVTRDPEKAYFWALLGGLQEPRLAEWYFEQLSGKLSEATRDRIRRAVQTWEPSS